MNSYVNILIIVFIFIVRKMFLSLPIVYEINQLIGSWICRKRIPELGQIKHVSESFMNCETICFQKGTFMNMSCDYIILKTYDPDTGGIQHDSFRISDDKYKIVIVNDMFVILGAGKQYIVYVEDKKIKTKPCETVKYNGLSPFQRIYPITHSDGNMYGSVLLNDNIIDLEYYGHWREESDRDLYFIQNHIIYKLLFWLNGEVRMQEYYVINGNVTKRINDVNPENNRIFRNEYSQFDLIDDENIVHKKTRYGDPAYHVHKIVKRTRNWLYPKVLSKFDRVANFSNYCVMITRKKGKQLLSKCIITSNFNCPEFNFTYSFDKYKSETLRGIHLQFFVDIKLVEYLYENINHLLNQSICRIIVEYCSV